MSLTLALDTSTVAAVGLARGTELVASRRFDDTRAHVEQTTPLVTSVLAEVGHTLADVSRIVVGTGPGPFTGLRVGLATAEVLGLALGVPVRGVCSLDVLATQAVAEGPLDGDFLVVTDARRRELYWSRHDAAGRRTAGPEVGPAEVLPDLPVVGPGSALHPDPARRLGLAAVLDAGVMACSADHLPDAGLEPLYLRRPDATVPGRPKSTLVEPPRTARLSPPPAALRARRRPQDGER
ncbi:tRNA (adenosine(37)-N6)-threonylcarbamoyltransferase complex dimerization subunit type 1 TsaB [Auraticoccus sp. F435]|uniref:tRNA (Adenosine(37)-N6)-threonylcarbamoyltransferase complex dimerization subunit type 1 TsaB n=1 Tax=Auraticoccus cholistanensis TaxID=2656650 RepID=A0A6A9UU56_9ACTN|nr:tRNA (adenosine(37)-N6)-threonylcarbamoyltransferase complex dimerization subunit type 1 TsaB [Auraticoccus cholistanensis]MVA76353.1 tRNA (adenosine(37)-N6)-threonylcarbamoyltransferase complex dimerization subunit type 1 TsaB [Auraticoccus cholistanensis]